MRMRSEPLEHGWAGRRTSWRGDRVCRVRESARSRQDDWCRRPRRPSHWLAALGCAVEALFRLSETSPGANRDCWAWDPPPGACRYWRAEVAGRSLLYPVEASSLGLLPHDGTARDGVLHDLGQNDPARTLVLASCDPAAAFLSAALAHTASLRLIVVPRSSRAALELLAQGLVHAAGVHLARSEHDGGNTAAIRPYLTRTKGASDKFQLLRLADWEEGIALAPSLRLNTIKSALRAKLRWIGREAGSGARQCLDELLGRSEDARSNRSVMPCARDHRGVAEAIRGHWADAGICLRLTCEEANLKFMSVRREAYDICFPASLAGDHRLRALVEVARSAAFRQTLGELPGYQTVHTGELAHMTIQGESSETAL